MTFVYLNSDKMGDGDPVLGKKLMNGFLTHLIQSEEKIDFINCINSAINLTCEGSEVLDVFRQFEKRGVKKFFHNRTLLVMHNLHKYMPLSLVLRAAPIYAKSLRREILEKCAVFLVNRGRS